MQKEEKNKRLFNIWSCMKQRCNNPNHTAARWYHEKGIRVCKEWENDFYSFQTWAYSNGYFDDASIDRINPNGNYSPDNCRWITLTENRKRAIRNKLPAKHQMKQQPIRKGKFMVVEQSDFARYTDPGTVVKTGLTKPEAGIFISQQVGDKYWKRRRYSILITGKQKEGDMVYLKDCRRFIKSRA